jgi:hypothetical protein
MTVARRFLGVLEVDSGTIIIGDPAYLLPSRQHAKPGVDYQAVLEADGDGDAVSFANGLTLLIQNFGGDGPYPAYGEYEDGELLRIVIELEPLELDESDIAG